MIESDGRIQKARYKAGPQDTSDSGNGHQSKATSGRQYSTGSTIKLRLTRGVHFGLAHIFHDASDVSI